MTKEPRLSSLRSVLINAVLILVAAFGVVIMILALVVAFTHPKSIKPSLGSMPMPTASPPSTADLIPPLVLQQRAYAFSKASDLKAFKQSGIGVAAIVNKRLRISTYPATTKSVSLTVHVDGGSTVSFDDSQSGDVEYDGSSFLIDGVSRKNVSGSFSGSAKYQVYALSAGTHTLTWRYRTDSTLVLPSDAYYVDNIKVTNNLPKGWY